MATYLGLRYLPNWVTLLYERTLLWTCPLIIILEGFAAMTVILSSGQLWSELLCEQRPLVKVLVLIASGGCCLFTVSVIVKLYLEGLITTVLSASLVAVLVTLMIILSIATVIIDHGTITDSSLLSLYSTYNLWLISRATKPIALRTGISVIDMIISRSGTMIWVKNAVGVARACLEIFSVEILAILMLQMALFIVATRLYQQACEEQDQGQNIKVADWFIGAVWPCFGRVMLVAIYTYSWLTCTQAKTLPLYLDPVVWRWTNIFSCLLIYTYHLLHPPYSDAHLD